MARLLNSKSEILPIFNSSITEALNNCNFFKALIGAYEILLLHLPPQLSHGVTGNTSGFGPEESRFEP